MSAQSEMRFTAGEQVLAIAPQHAESLAHSASDAGRAAGSWQRLAEFLDELVTEYDAHLESGCCAHASPASTQALSAVLDGFDVAAAVSRTNAEVLDDLATEITIAQARMRAVCNEWESERDARARFGARAIERTYSARATREVWCPLNGDLTQARERLRVVRDDG